MPSEPFDIAVLAPGATSAVKLLIRLRRESVYIQVSSAERQPGARSGVLGGATQWRQGPVLIRVPAKMRITSIELDTAE